MRRTPFIMQQRTLVRAPEPGDRDAWVPMYLEYAVAVKSSHTGQAEADVLWKWLLEGTHRVGAFFAFVDERLAGFAVYRPFPRTLDGNEACYLDDLFVDSVFRGLGIAERLVDAVKNESVRRGWTEVRWVTLPDNARARKLYDRIAVDADLVTYRLIV